MKVRISNTTVEAAMKKKTLFYGFSILEHFFRILDHACSLSSSSKIKVFGL